LVDLIRVVEESFGICRERKFLKTVEKSPAGGGGPAFNNKDVVIWGDAGIFR